MNGPAGRGARDMAQNQRETEHQLTPGSPGLASTPPPANYIWRQTEARLSSTEMDASGPSDPSADQATERETDMPSLEEIAERVYRLFYQELRQERERRGRWR